MMLALAILLVAPANPADTTWATPLDCPGGQRITKSEIEVAGVARISDLLPLFNGIRISSVGGHSWKVAHVGGVPFGQNGYGLLLDDQPISTGVFGEQDLDHLPVPLMDIASVTLCPDPGLWAGQFHSFGSLRIETVEAAEGLQANASFLVGNETGDPGPHLFTDQATPNIPHTGPDLEGSGAYRRGGTVIRAEGRVLDFQPDQSSTLRVREATSERPPFRAPSIFGLRAHFPAPNGVINANIVVRFVENLWFVEQAGRELPAAQVDIGGTMHGRHRFPLPSGPSVRLDYRAMMDVQTLEPEESLLQGFDPEWRQTRLVGTVQASVRRTRGELAIGSTVERLAVSAPGVRNGAGYTLGTLFAQATMNPASRLQQRTDAALITNGDVVRLKLANTLVWQRQKHIWSAAVALDSRLPEEQSGFAYWHARGYRGLLLPEVSYTQAEPPGTSSEYSARIAWSAELGQGISANASFAGRLMRGLTIERPSFQLDGGELAVHGNIDVIEDAQGETVSGNVAVMGEYGPISARLAGSLLSDVGGNPAFRDAWERVPSQQASAALTIQPDPNFVAQVVLTVASSAHWRGYEGVTGAPVPNIDFTYDATVPTHARLDATASKYIWGRRLRVSLLMRNLLNTTERFHPIGEQFGFTVFARVEARIGL